jgi:gamma-glutamyltranspeptidase / glutathione hydrolase
LWRLFNLIRRLITLISLHKTGADGDRVTSVSAVIRQAGVAAGNPDTAEAAIAVLRAGGNAFDAAVAAGFAAAVTEPALTSLGGGGFLLAAPVDGGVTVFDFFVDAPGRGRAPERLEPSFQPVTVKFAGAEQIFYAGWGSVAVPGCLDGYLHVHRRLGRLPLSDVVAPARDLAANGTVIGPTQAELFALLEQILTLSPDGRAIFAPRGELLRIGDLMRNEALAGLLDAVAAGRVRGFASPQIALPLERVMNAGGGLLTGADLSAYAVVEREPLRATYRGGQLSTNPPPSLGGSIVLAALAELDRQDWLDSTPEAYVRLAEALVGLSERHTLVPQSVHGTTHISVVDGEGNVAAMTTSNGSCSGQFAPGTGIQLNNVMGEADLHPEGFHATPPGLRIGSMMAPTLVVTEDGTMVGLGSGGSERIRSALTCVITGLLDRRQPLDVVLDAPRMHWDRELLHVEPGLPAPAIEALGTRWPMHIWDRRSLYFGGAHAASRSRDGQVRAAGDARRGGVGMVVQLDSRTR